MQSDESKNDQPLSWEIITLKQLNWNQQLLRDLNQSDSQLQNPNSPQGKLSLLESNDLKNTEDISSIKKLLSDKWYSMAEIIGELLDLYESTNDTTEPVDVSRQSLKFRMMIKIAEMAGLIKSPWNNKPININLLTLLKS